MGGSLILLTALAAPASERSLVRDLGKALHLSEYASPMVPPDFRATDAQGRPVSLGNLRGSVVLITFWASWCIECRPEMPLFEKLHQDYLHLGLNVIGVNFGEAYATVLRYARELSLTFPLVPDRDGEIYRAFGVVGLPTTFLIRRDGSAAGLAIGPRNWENPPARKLIELLLAEPAKVGRQQTAP